MFLHVISAEYIGEYKVQVSFKMVKMQPQIYHAFL